MDYGLGEEDVTRFPVFVRGLLDDITFRNREEEKLEERRIIMDIRKLPLTEGKNKEVTLDRNDSKETLKKKVTNGDFCHKGSEVKVGE